MRKVKVKRDELLKTIRENREQHCQDYLEAMEGYREAFAEALREAASIIAVRQARLEEEGSVNPKAIAFELTRPESHEKDYDQVICMLEMSVDDELEISSDEFACYVMDDWDWKVRFESVTSNYKMRK